MSGQNGYAEIEKKADLYLFFPIWKHMETYTVWKVETQYTLLSSFRSILEIIWY